MSSTNRERVIVGGATAAVAVPASAALIGTQFRALHAVDTTGRADEQIMAKAFARIETGRSVGRLALLGVAGGGLYSQFRAGDGPVDWSTGGIIAAGSGAVFVTGAGTRTGYSVLYSPSGELRPFLPATNILERVDRARQTGTARMPGGISVLQHAQRLLRG